MPPTPSPFARPAPRPVIRAAVIATVLLLPSGCAIRTALRSSFNDYGDVYAQTQNRQMLLNLARLHQHEPPYFFQLAQISASYTFGSTATLGASRETGFPTNAPTNFKIVNGSLGGSATHQPIFTLVPLAGEKFAQQLLEPLPPEVFFDLYEEGWPIDMLMRVLIQKIEIMPNPQPGHENETAILENDPWACADDPNSTTAPTDGPKGYYDRFLRACAMAREFQRNGLLYVAVNEKKSEPPSAGPMETQLANAIASWIRANTKGGSGGDDTSPAPGPIKKTGSGAKSSSGGAQQFYFRVIGNNDAEKLTKLLAARPEYSGPDDPITKFNWLLRGGGIGVVGRPVVDTGEHRIHLVMRSLITAMSALANEEKGFEFFQRYYGNQRAIHTGQDGTVYWAPLPPLEERPTLELVAKGKTRTFVTVDYEGQRYAIADGDLTLAGIPDTWNRDVFRLLVQLSFLATANPTEFATPSLLQLH